MALCNPQLNSQRMHPQGQDKGQELLETVTRLQGKETGQSRGGGGEDIAQVHKGTAVPGA